MNIGTIDYELNSKQDRLLTLHYFKNIGGFRLFLSHLKLSTLDNIIPIVYDSYSVLDTTTYTVKLPEQVYDKLINVFKEHLAIFAPDLILTGQDTPCFSKAFKISQLVPMLPDIQTVFEDSYGEWHPKAWAPENYLLQKTFGLVCVSVARWPRREVSLGLAWMKQRQVYFDLDRQTVGIQKGFCDLAGDGTTREDVIRAIAQAADGLWREQYYLFRLRSNRVFRQVFELLKVGCDSLGFYEFVCFLLRFVVWVLLLLIVFLACGIYRFANRRDYLCFGFSDTLNYQPVVDTEAL